MPSDTANPWLFRRDEIDVLEEELDEIFHLHKHEDDGIHFDMEEEVISEQTKTEEQFERRLSEMLGPTASLAAHSHICTHCKDGFPDGVKMTEMLVPERDPLYAQAYTWAVRVFYWARDCYWMNGMRNKDMFRVQINAYLVPVKIAFAQVEHHRKDPHATKIMDLEFDLALTYLRRTRVSLGTLTTTGVASSDLEWMMEEADRIAEKVEEKKSKK